MLEQARTWLVLIGTIVGWAIGLTTVWNKLIARLNGLGRRVAATEKSDEYLRGRLDEISSKQGELELKHSEQLARLREFTNEREASLRERLAAVERELEINRAEKARGD